MEGKILSAMNEQELRAWLNQENQQLLEEIENIIPVRFTLWDKNYHACQVHKAENDSLRPVEVEVYYRNETSQAKIAHEMLHAKTSIILGDGISLYDVPNKTLAYEGLLQNNNSDKIVTACEHVIFFPDYLDMGFREEDCFEEYELSQESRDLLTFLCGHGLRLGGRYDVNRVYQYLSLGFSLYFYPNSERFQDEVRMLSQLDRGLFSKLENLREACTDLEVVSENKEYLSDAYRQFGTEINHWFRVNRAGR